MMMTCFSGKADLLKALNEEAAPEVFYKKRVLKNFPKSTRKKRLWQRCFPENFKNIFFTQHLWTSASETLFPAGTVV